MLMRMSAIARCAATPSTCDSENAVTASTSVAPPAANASGISSSARPLPDDVVDQELGRRRKHQAGKAVDEHQREAEASRPRWAQTSSRASAQAFAIFVFRLGSSHCVLRRLITASASGI